MNRYDLKQESQTRTRIRILKMVREKYVKVPKLAWGKATFNTELLEITTETINALENIDELDAGNYVKIESRSANLFRKLAPELGKLNAAYLGMMEEWGTDLSEEDFTKPKGQLRHNYDNALIASEAIRLINLIYYEWKRNLISLSSSRIRIENAGAAMKMVFEKLVPLWQVEIGNRSFSQVREFMQAHDKTTEEYASERRDKAKHELVEMFDMKLTAKKYFEVEYNNWPDPLVTTPEQRLAKEIETRQEINTGIIAILVERIPNHYTPEDEGERLQLIREIEKNTIENQKAIRTYLVDQIEEIETRRHAKKKALLKRANKGEQAEKVDQEDTDSTSSEDESSEDSSDYEDEDRELNRAIIVSSSDSSDSPDATEDTPKRSSIVRLGKRKPSSPRKRRYSDSVIFEHNETRVTPPKPKKKKNEIVYHVNKNRSKTGKTSKNRTQTKLTKKGPAKTMANKWLGGLRSSKRLRDLRPRPTKESG